MRSDGQVCKLRIELPSCICHFLSCAIGDHLVIIINRLACRVGTRKVVCKSVLYIGKKSCLKRLLAV